MRRLAALFQRLGLIGFLLRVARGVRVKLRLDFVIILHLFFQCFDGILAAVLAALTQVAALGLELLDGLPQQWVLLGVVASVDELKVACLEDAPTSASRQRVVQVS